MPRKEVWAINRMTDKRLIGFQHPENPVILSKTQVALLQIYGGAKPLNATGCQPVESRRHPRRTRIDLAQRSRNQKNRTTDAHRFTLIAKSNPKNLRSLRRF
jgi:hypothetical protein